MRLACAQKTYSSQVRFTLADQLRGLLGVSVIEDDIDHACVSIARQQYWRDGWVAVRQTLRFDSSYYSSEELARLNALEQSLKPNNLVEKVKAIVLNQRLLGLELDGTEFDEDGFTGHSVARIEHVAHSLGMDVAADEQALSELLPELFSCESGHLMSFGEGLQEGTSESRAGWDRLVAQFRVASDTNRNAGVHCGYLRSLQKNDISLDNYILDDTALDKTMPFPLLQTSVAIDNLGVKRLFESLEYETSPIEQYQFLAYGRASDPIGDSDLCHLIVTIASKKDGFFVAIKILYMRIYSSLQRKIDLSTELGDAGRELLRDLTFSRNDILEAMQISEVISHCLLGRPGISIAKEIAHKYFEAASKNMTHDVGITPRFWGACSLLSPRRYWMPCLEAVGRILIRISVNSRVFTTITEIR